MKIAIQLQFLMLIAAAMLMSSAAMPTGGRRRRARDITDDQQQQRYTRRVGNLNVTTTSLQYMQSLYEEYERENMKERQSTDKPTDVWCFPDKDIAREAYREKMIRATKCAAYTEYVFHWGSVQDDMEVNLLEVESGKLRAYMQTINRHIREGSSVDVNITAYMILRNNATSNITFNSTDFSDAVFAGEETVSVTHGSEDWIELNVTEGFQEIWPSIPDNTEVKIILKAEVNCVDQKKVPISFVNPAEIPLEKEVRRARHMDLQPLLVVFANNRDTKKVLSQEDEDAGGDDGNGTNTDINYERLSGRNKRSGDECSLQRYVVNLRNIGLTNVIAPVELNISKCAGNCNARTIINRMGTNHARIMMSIYNAEVNAGANPTATAPCCVPKKYAVAYLLMNSHDGTATAVKSHNELIARGCSCR